MNRINFKNAVRVSFLVLSAMPVAAIPSWAQGARPMLEEVIVTAQKREQTLEEIPGSVSVMTADMLDKTNTSTLADIGKISAGMRLESTRDGNSPVLRIRGIGTQRFNAAVRPSVGVFVDEVAKPRIDTAFTNLNDVARIEILKGPQATLYGKQVSAGLISIVTNKPLLEEFEGKVQAKLGSSDLQEYRGTLNIPMGKRLATRVNAYYTDSTFEQVENVVNGNSEEVNATGGRARILFLPTDELEMILSLERHESETEDVGLERLDYGPTHLSFAAADGVTLLPADPFDGKIQSIAPASRKSTNNAAAFHLSWDFSDSWAFNSISSYEDFSRKPIGGLSGAGDSTFSALTGSAIVVGPQLPGALFTANFVDDDSYSQEVRATYDGDNLSSIIGLFYAKSEQTTETNIARRIFPTLMNPIVSSLDKTSEDMAIFTQNTWYATDSLDITIGLRYSETENTDDSAIIIGGGAFADNPTVTPDYPHQNDTWNAFSGTLKFSYALADDVSVYAGYDRGYKAGGFNTPIYSGGSFSSPEDFDSEEANNYEVGLKGRFFDQRVRLSFAAFYQTYDDFQLPIPDPVTGVGMITENAGEVVSQGIETEFAWLVGEHWTLDGNVAFIDSRYGDYESAPCYGGQTAPDCAPDQSGTMVQDLSDEKVDNHSPWTAALSATYDNLVGDTGMSWYARGEVAFRDEYIGLIDQDPRAMQSSYSLLNASLGLTSADESWTVVLWGKNLADEEYASTYLKASDEGVPGNVASILLRPGDERSYGADLTYRF